MRGRLLLFSALTCLTLIGQAWPAHAQMAAPAATALARASDLPQDLGKTVTVQGRPGYIVTQYQSQGMNVFTLRDDYNGQVLVRTIGDTYPVMGDTYRITGSPERVNGTLFLDSAPDMMSPLYPLVTPAPPAPRRSELLLWLPTALSGLAILLVLGYGLARWLNRTRPEWGVLSVTSGPDRGLTVPLRRRRIALGRGVSPAQDVRLSAGDETISNRHALLEFRGGQMYVCDMSTNGTRIGGERLTPDRPVRVNSGDLIHLGTRGTVVIVRLHGALPSLGLLSHLRETAPLSDKTIMVSEMPTEESGWKDPAPEEVEEAKVYAAKAAPQTYHHPAAPVTAPAQDPAGKIKEDEEDEEDIPHTLAAPMVFTFAGHTPKPGRVFSDNGHEHQRDADEAITPDRG